MPIFTPEALQNAQLAEMLSAVELPDNWLWKRDRCELLNAVLELIRLNQDIDRRVTGSGDELLKYLTEFSRIAASLTGKRLNAESQARVAEYINSQLRRMASLLARRMTYKGNPFLVIYDSLESGKAGIVIFMMSKYVFLMDLEHNLVKSKESVHYGRIESYTRTVIRAEHDTELCRRIEEQYQAVKADALRLAKAIDSNISLIYNSLSIGLFDSTVALFCQLGNLIGFVPEVSSSHQDSKTNDKASTALSSNDEDSKKLEVVRNEIRKKSWRYKLLLAALALGIGISPLIHVDRISGNAPRIGRTVKANTQKKLSGKVQVKQARNGKAGKEGMDVGDRQGKRRYKAKPNSNDFGTGGGTNEIMVPKIPKREKEGLIDPMVGKPGEVMPGLCPYTIKTDRHMYEMYFACNLMNSFGADMPENNIEDSSNINVISTFSEMIHDIRDIRLTFFTDEGDNLIPVIYSDNAVYVPRYAHPQPNVGYSVENAQKITLFKRDNHYFVRDPGRVCLLEVLYEKASNPGLLQTEFEQIDFKGIQEDRATDFENLLAGLSNEDNLHKACSLIQDFIDRHYKYPVGVNMEFTPDSNLPIIVNLINLDYLNCNGANFLGGYLLAMHGFDVNYCTGFYLDEAPADKWEAVSSDRGHAFNIGPEGIIDFTPRGGPRMSSKSMAVKTLERHWKEITLGSIVILTGGAAYLWLWKKRRESQELQPIDKVEHEL